MNLKSAVTLAFTASKEGSKDKTVKAEGDHPVCSELRENWGYGFNEQRAVLSARGSNP